MTFDGFVPPTKNFFHMPNEWINICAGITNLAELKVVQYVLRHTWGFQEYGVTKTITVEEFMYGRKRNDGTRMDNGTGLKSDRSVKDGIKDAIDHGYLMCEIDDSDKARIKKSYGLKMSSELGQVDTTPQDSEIRGVVSTPQTGRYYPSEVQNLPLYKVDTTPRSEKDTIERHLGNTPKKESTIDASASTHTQSENVVPFENGLKRRITDNHLKAMKGHNDDTTLNQPLLDQPTRSTTSDSMDAGGDMPGLRDIGNGGQLARPQAQALSVDSSHSQVDIGNDDFDTDAYERETIAAFFDVPTEKMQAVKKGQVDGSVDNSDLSGNTSVDYPGVQNMEHGERTGAAEAPEALGLEHTPGAGMPLPLATTPPGDSQGDATSGQAIPGEWSVTPARHSGTPPDTSVKAGAAQVIPKRPPRRKPLVMPEPKPTITLTAQEQAFWDLWLAVWFNVDIPPKLTETAHEHVVKLAPHITSEPQLKSLIERAKQDLQERQGVTRRMVHLGNLVNSYPGWKQEQQQGKKKISKNGLDLEQYGIQAMLRRQEAM